MAYCGHCGNRVDGPARFCPACGASVDSAPVAAAPVPAASPAVSPASIPAPAVPASAVPPSIPAAPVAPSVYAASAAPQPAPTVPLPALPIPAPAAYQATDATAVLASQRKSSKKLIAALCALLATILVAALAFIIPNFTAVKAMLGFRPTNPLVVIFDAINSLSTLRSTKYELRTHSSTDDSLDARMSGMYSLGQNHQ